MIDIHSHLLHGLDDGSRTLENSIAMARIAAGDGITRLVCTPHASYTYAYQPDLVAARLAELRAALAAENIPLELGVGCDFHLSYDNINDAENHPGRYTINGKRYLLVELDELTLPRSLNEIFYNLQTRGMSPILTHPERNATLAAQPEVIGPWINNGLLVQVTANSLTGGMGRTAEKIALRLLSQGWVHFVASDSHNTKSRPPILSQAYDVVRRRAGEATAHRLFVENPGKAWDGTYIADPEPWETELPPKRNFFSRLFGK